MNPKPSQAMNLIALVINMSFQAAAGLLCAERIANMNIITAPDFPLHYPGIWIVVSKSQ